MPNDKQIYEARLVSIEACIEAHRQEALACQKVISRLSRIQRTTSDYRPIPDKEIQDLYEADLALGKAEGYAQQKIISLANDQLE